MAPINETEVPAEPTIWKEQAARNAVSANNSHRWVEMQEYFKSLPEHHVKAPKTRTPDNTRETTSHEDE
ncbi:hypothetical protein IAD21_00670 [Abditibacteriota bacterium]|nr:hypothetical protein IAD21_00670 [Abditibacteriota bacterium]